MQVVESPSVNHGNRCSGGHVINIVWGVLATVVVGVQQLVVPEEVPVIVSVTLLLQVLHENKVKAAEDS